MAAPSLWLVNHYADAPDRPNGTRHFDLARVLVARGRRVTIFAAAFSHVTQRDDRLAGRRLYRTERFDGVDFVWLRTSPYKGNTWRRMVNMASFAVVFFVVQFRFRAPDAVVGSTVHPFAALAAWVVARIRRARFLFEIRDLWPQTLVDLGAMRDGSVGERLLRWIEAFLVRRATRVITLLPGVASYLAGRGLPTDRVVYIPNGVDLGVFDAPVAEPPPAAVAEALDAVRDLRAGGRFVLGYVGSFGRVNRLDVIIAAAAAADEREPGRTGLVIVGDGPERAELERLATAAPGVVIIAPAVPKRFVPTVLRALDAAVVHATSTPVYRYGISFNKLFEYMAAGRPVLFACDSAYDPVADVGAGISVQPDRPDLLADALVALVATPAERLAAMGAAGRSYVEREHNIDGLASRLADAIDGPAVKGLEPLRASR